MVLCSAVLAFVAVQSFSGVPSATLGRPTGTFASLHRPAPLPAPLATSLAASLPARRAGTVQLSGAENGGSKLPFLLDPGTKGGIIFWSIVGLIVPFVAYSFMLDTLGWDVVLAGNVILIGYVGLGTVVWTGSYVFRVANKDMTYAQQLRDYENAVIQKRFEELSETEVNALMGEIYPGQPAQPTQSDDKP